jgi:hypothetical protein
MNYSALLKQVIEDPEEVEGLVEEILKAKTVHLYGMGRMQLTVRLIRGRREIRHV